MRAFKQAAQVWTAIRLIQAICGALILILLFSAFKDTWSNPSDGQMYRLAQLNQFFLAMVAYTSMVYGLVYVVFVSLVPRLTPDLLLERIMDAIVAMAYIVVGFVYSSANLGCTLGDAYTDCSCLRTSVFLNFFGALLSLLALALSIITKTISSSPRSFLYYNNFSNPEDRTENLVPRGHFGDMNHAARSSLCCSDPGGMNHRESTNAAGFGPRPSYPLHHAGAGAGAGGRPSHTYQKKAMMRGNSPSEDNSNNLVPRGHFGGRNSIFLLDPRDTHGQGNADKLDSHGYFGSAAPSSPRTPTSMYYHELTKDASRDMLHVTERM
jgi:hypothetical protein